MRNFNVYDPMKRGQGLVLDGQTLAHIEVLVNNEGTEEGSLLELLGRCVTPFGEYSGCFSLGFRMRADVRIICVQASDCSGFGYACP